MKNKNIIKYTAKYFLLLFVTSIGYGFANEMLNAKSDFANYSGLAILLAIAIGWVTVLSDDLKKIK